MSKHPKHSWCKHPSKDLEIDSNEYEWDSILEPSTVYMDIGIVHTYSSKPELVVDSCVGSNDLNSHITLVDDSFLVRKNPDLGSLGSYLTNSDSLVTRDIIHIHNLEPIIDLPLVHPDLIDWSQHNHKLELLMFQNYNEITYYLNAIEHVVSSTNELATNMIEPDIKYLILKIKRK